MEGLDRCEAKGGLGFRVSLGFRVWGLGLGSSNLRFGVQGFRVV